MQTPKLREIKVSPVVKRVLGGDTGWCDMKGWRLKHSISTICVLGVGRGDLMAVFKGWLNLSEGGKREVAAPGGRESNSEACLFVGLNSPCSLGLQRCDSVPSEAGTCPPSSHGLEASPQCPDHWIQKGFPSLLHDIFRILPSSLLILGPSLEEIPPTPRSRVNDMRKSSLLPLPSMEESAVNQEAWI